MKREVERTRKIPAFSIEIGELEALWQRLVALFENSGDVYGSINIEFPKEKLEFKDVEELRQYPDLKGKVTNFSLWLSKDGRRVSIRSSSLFNPQAVVSATAESEAWCAGALETVHSFLKSYKVWYHWFVSVPLGWVLFIFANIPSIAMLARPKDSIDKIVLIGWLAAMIALVFLYVFKGKLFPASVLRITDEESFVRRHSAELGLIIALTSAVLTVVGWFLGGKGA
ncbi:MAG: hypothetical protein COZ50_01565 [Zetaproteobacteria bacterium CG_4_10_14_3_um_filter_54_28]|nr:MAG: hypothetical protein COZ50_01565 [Zetaproteobacteria bacterium CG_4_10_14_3_um_filter_54_28]